MAVAAELGDVDVISVDSMQVYRGMDIGTAKPATEDQGAVRHYCIDLVEPTAEFTVAEFKRAHATALDDIAERARRALLVGGTGLYHRVVIDDFNLPGEWPEVRAGLDHHETNTLYQQLRELDPKATEKIDPENRRRLLRALEVTIGSGQPFSSFGPGVDHYPDTGVAQVGLRWPRPVITERIEARVHAMIDGGLMAEVAALSDAGFSKTSAQALGYKETLQHLRGEISHDEAVAMIITRTRQFAVRQERWFRRDPRVRWIDIESDPVAEVAPTVIEELQRA
jgi:tRNA dimethylallyltransferase